MGGQILRMLTKIDSRMIRQRDPARHRRWWHSPDGDLLVDQDLRTDETIFFELDWEGDAGVRECVRWGRVIGLSTGTLDTGDRLGALAYKQSPIILLDPEVRSARLVEARRFLKGSGVPGVIQEEILSRLRD